MMLRRQFFKAIASVAVAAGMMPEPIVGTKEEVVDIGRFELTGGNPRFLILRSMSSDSGEVKYSVSFKRKGECVKNNTSTRPSLTATVEDF